MGMALLKALVHWRVVPWSLDAICCRPLFHRSPERRSAELLFTLTVLFSLPDRRLRPTPARWGCRWRSVPFWQGWCWVDDRVSAIRFESTNSSIPLTVAAGLFFVPASANCWSNPPMLRTSG